MMGDPESVLNRVMGIGGPCIWISEHLPIGVGVPLNWGGAYPRDRSWTTAGPTPDVTRAWYARDMEPKDPVTVEHIMQFFAYAHLPAHLQEVSRPFGELADRIVDTLPRNPERTVALRKLLESKDAAVRSGGEVSERLERAEKARAEARAAREGAARALELAKNEYFRLAELESAAVDEVFEARDAEREASAAASR